MHESLAEAGNLTRMRALRGKAVLIVLHLSCAIVCTIAGDRR